jgi:hypothetical protein
MVAIADGCVPPSVDPIDSQTKKATNNCVASNNVSANGLVNHGAIIRQESGKGLFRKYDPTPPTTVGSRPPLVQKPTSGRSLAPTGLNAWWTGAGLLLLLGGAERARRHLRHNRP